MAHHLGNEVSKAPDRSTRPSPRGAPSSGPSPSTEVPEAGTQARLVLDVVQVVGEANGLEFSEIVRKGELRTNVWLNGREVDYLNRHITTRNETPERIRLPIPAGLLKAGENRIRIEQVGKLERPELPRRPRDPGHRREFSSRSAECVGRGGSR